MDKTLCTTNLESSNNIFSIFTFFEASLDFNNFLKPFIQLLIYINSNKDKSIIVYPENILDSLDLENPTKRFWEMLVIQYGNYGVNSNLGWLENNKIHSLIPNIKKFLELYKYNTENGIWQY